MDSSKIHKVDKNVFDAMRHARLVFTSITSQPHFSNFVKDAELVVNVDTGTLRATGTFVGDKELVLSPYRSYASNTMFSVTLLDLADIVDATRDL